MFHSHLDQSLLTTFTKNDWTQVYFDWIRARIFPNIIAHEEIYHEIDNVTRADVQIYVNFQQHLYLYYWGDVVHSLRFWLEKQFVLNSVVCESAKVMEFHLSDATYEYSNPYKTICTHCVTLLDGKSRILQNTAILLTTKVFPIFCITFYSKVANICRIFKELWELKKFLDTHGLLM